MDTLSPYLLCPVCKEQLVLADDQKGLCCRNKHRFDRAKQGYHNLLLSQNKRSKHPGDTTEMVAARRDFLDQGYYANLAERFIHHAEDALAKDSEKAFHYCDLACGEGYYTHKLHTKLLSYFQEVYTSGIDISTPAIKSACRRDKSINWWVGSAANIPLADNSQDLVSGLFFHFDLEEISRTVRPGGHVILVNTGPRHLIELRRVIYDELKAETRTEFESLPTSLQHVKTDYFEQTIQLPSSQDIINLFSMTPHYWRCKPEKRALLESLDTLDLQLDIQF
ncbi:hypothetical protein A3740_23400, partial [Oleiphilus sp. HI0068]